MLPCCWVLPLGSDSDSGDDGDNGNNNGTQLAAPVLAQSSVEETAFTVTWQAVEHANVYAYSLDGGAEATTSNLRPFERPESGNGL